MSATKFKSPKNVALYGLLLSFRANFVQKYDAIQQLGTENSVASLETIPAVVHVLPQFF
jgi:hypothetical protein